MRQIFLNTLLLMMSYVKSMEATDADRKHKLKALGISDENALVNDN